MWTGSGDGSGQVGVGCSIEAMMPEMINITILIVIDG